MKAHRQELEGVPKSQTWDNLINKNNNKQDKLQLRGK